LSCYINFCIDNDGLLSDNQVNDIINEAEMNLDADNLEHEIATVLNPYSYNEPLPLTQCIRCSAHTLQLCIENGLQQPVNLNIMKKARKVCDLSFILYLKI